jgi:hypothetical protein
VCAGSSFITYENRYKHDESHDPFDIPVRPLGPHKSFPALGDIDVEASLFDPYGSTTLEKKKLRLSFNNNGQCTAKEIQ